MTTIEIEGEGASGADARPGDGDASRADERRSRENALGAASRADERRSREDGLEADARRSPEDVLRADARRSHEDPLGAGVRRSHDRPLRADARRNHERILEGARTVFSRCGVDAQMDDVARQAGVGVGTVYRHFPTKEALMAELVRQKFRIFAGNARRALEREGEPFAVFADVLRQNAEVCARDAAVQHALTGIGENIWTQAEAEFQDLTVPTAELIARAQRAGTMRSDVTVRDIPMLMCGVSATMARTGPGFDWHRHLELIISMLRA